MDHFDMHQLVNPLWGHCQEYKVEKYAIPKRLLSEEKKHFCLLQPYLVWKYLVSLIKKNKSKSSGHTEKFAKSRPKEKSPGRMRTKRQNHKVYSFLRRISTSPGHWENS